MKFKRISQHYIAALGDDNATSGTGAELWGLWPVDPGPRGVPLNSYGRLKAALNIAPAKWTFDRADWWLEERGLIMEPPQFPMPPGQYLVTGDRDVEAVLTVHPKDQTGTQRWELSDGATIYDVTHRACRSARYTPAQGAPACGPIKAKQHDFPVMSGEPMPAVEGCNKQDYAVLIVIGVPATD